MNWIIRFLRRVIPTRTLAALTFTPFLEQSTAEEWKEREKARRKRDAEELIHTIQEAMAPIQAKLDESQRRERIRNLCILTAAWLQAKTTAGMHSDLIGEEAVSAAEETLFRIGIGPEYDTGGDS